MDVHEVPEDGWRLALPGMSDEALLQAELSHRVRDEVAAALASMHLALARGTTRGREDMVRSAIKRMEGFGAVLDAFAMPPDAPVDMGHALAAMCDGLLKGRPSLEGSMFTIDANCVLVEADMAQRILIVAHELVHDAIGRIDSVRGMIAVVFRGRERDISLAVIDDVRRPRGPSRRRGARKPICEELVRRAGGRISRRSGDDGTRVRVWLPGTSVVPVPF